ncbi:hypothetical protein [Amycolatopsis thailandensis]|nr:hypothetical protein [Amycolatopsis thailandensis]
MEIMVLRTVVETWRKPGDDAEGAPRGVNLSRLNYLLQLGRRMTLDLVFDLWRREHITLDLYTGTVAPSPAVVEAFRDGAQSQLAGGEYKLENVTVWLDRVSGHLTGRTGHTRPPDRDLVVPPDTLFAATMDDVRGSDVVRAVQEMLEDQQHYDATGLSARGRALRVMETKLPLSSHTQMTSRTTYLPVDITVRRDPESDVVRVTAVQDSRRGQVHCERISSLLTQFVEQRPNHKFSRRLQASLETRLTNPPTMERSVARLEALAEQALTAAAGNRTAVHEQLVDAIQTARGQVNFRVSGEAQVKPMGTEKECRDEARAMISRAERQVVLVASTVRYDGLADLLPALSDVARRGVQIVLLWGQRHDDRIESRAENILEELRLAAKAEQFNPSTLVVARRSANTNVDMIIADNREALVGGSRYLGLRNDVQQLGVIVEAVGEDSCEPVEGLLRWVRRSMPDGATAARVFFRSRDFVGGTEELVPAADRLNWSDLPSALGRDAVSDAAVRGWALAWRRCSAEIRQTLAARRWPSVTLIENAAHREALWDGLRTATSQVLISSEFLASSVVTPKLVEVLRQRIRAGVQIQVSYYHQRKGSDKAVSMLAALTTEGSSGFAFKRVQSAARALVCDDDVVVGNFDFLSHEGFYTGQPGRRPAAEIGLRISGGGFAAQTAALLGAPVLRRQRPAANKLDQVDHHSHQLLLALESQVSPVDRNALISQAVRTGDSLRLLADLREASAPDDVLRVAVASALRNRLADTAPKLQVWADWLVDDLWANYRFAEAWIIRRSLPDGLLPLPIVAAAAAAETPYVAEALATASLADQLTTAQAAALVSLAARQVLAWPLLPQQPSVPPLVANEVREVLVLLSGLKVLSDDWRALADLVVQCPPEIDDPGLAAIARRQLAHRHRDGKVAEAWDGADETLRSLAGTSFTFEAGLKTHARLMHENGLFGRLRTIVDNRDLTALTHWTRAEEVNDLAEFLDQTTAQVMLGRKNNVIHSSKRRAYLDRLKLVRAAALTVASFDDEHADPRTSYLLTRAQPVAERLAGLWPNLCADLDNHPRLERRLTEHGLGAISTISEWGGHVYH